MLHPFRSAFLVIAALSASTVAPAQVRPVSPNEPVLSGMSELPAQIVPAVLQAPELPAATPDELAPADQPEATDDETTAPRPTGDLAALVASWRSSDAGSRELECLAGAIYFESKSESLKGQH
jgi:hypothetical protein